MAGRGRACPAGQLRDSSDSDSEARVAGLRPCPGSIPCTQVIHSGHFMVSSPHSDSAPRGRNSGGPMRYDFDTVNRTWCQTYRYGPQSSGSLSIDPTLTRLFDCMSLAYSGKIVSPKWKSFKGLRLLWRDKIRLNNAIWRAWFIQYVEKRKNPVCGFVTPLEGSEADAHRKPEAIVLEGSYWKRRIEVVIKEYHKWRIYYKKRGQICQAKLEKWSNQMYQEPEAAPVEVHMFDLDCLLSDISDTLFTMTQKPCPWAGDRHDTYTSNADIIQPGLTPLQPNLEDFMDIPDIFMNYRGQPTEQIGFADCGFFESSSSSALPQPSSSNTRPDQTGPGQGCADYHTSSIISGTSPYGHQSYPAPPVSIAFTPGIEQPSSSSIPFLYPPPCHKFGFYTTTSGTPTVITHTASTMGAQGSVHQAHGYPHTGDTYPQTPCHSLSYPAAVSDVAPAAHCFSVPEQVAGTGLRGKHKQKTGGARTAGKPSLGFDATPVPAKGRRSSSPISTLQHGAAWPAGIPALTPLHSQSAPPGPSGPHVSTSRGPAASALLSHGAAHTGAALLIPKTEKLSPVQLYGTDRSSLTDKTSTPEPPHSCFSVQGKIESSKQTETRRITHISAEQKRRFNIKLGFDTLHNLVTTLSSQPSIKISKATTLQKTADACQQQLPATGVPITRQRFDHMRQRFREYVQEQTLRNWKRDTTIRFAFRHLCVLHKNTLRFSIIIEPLFESYNGMVSTASVEDLLVLSSLRLLSTTTAILTDPSLLPEQAALAVTRGNPAAALDHSSQPPTRDNVHPM
ncbi:hypothetical protein FQN60_000257 [Etheostoma spectabile]|uniref:BHLH domain-containing protein n=1 Tax=Etheostoma spectabile TaxID=54343 RepID=A0A5J5D4E8_9PERO|nr:hypothetical protein FQN60_000257 [Etheostoma spectabile]